MDMVKNKFPANLVWMFGKPEAEDPKAARYSYLYMQLKQLKAGHCQTGR